MSNTTKQTDATNTHVCPWQAVRGFDNFLRPLVHSPKKLFGPYVKPGMIALDVGCGRGFASLGLANLVGDDGMVISADLQPEMLDMVKQRAVTKGVEKRIMLHQCKTDKVGYESHIDFALNFWMLHEVPSQQNFLTELYSVMNDGGHLFVAEPLFHVPKHDFATSVELAKTIGFKEIARPNVRFSRAVVLQK